jgi:AraC family transcriptional regulator of adaptative response / DNA-3-methyladenine glycosylase II
MSKSMGNSISPQEHLLYESARQRKDAGFDGVFYFAVKTTGIVCRPSCPAPVAKSENVILYKQLKYAFEDGFRPCHRCRPESIHYVDEAEQIVSKAMAMLASGGLRGADSMMMAKALFVSERRLRQAFQAVLGVTPVRMLNHDRILRAVEAVCHTRQQITAIAFEAGFHSVRQFNAQFKAITGYVPSALREESEALQLPMPSITLRLKANNAAGLETALDFMKPRMMQGIESMTGHCYQRTYHLSSGNGYISVYPGEATDTLMLQVHTLDFESIYDVYWRVRRMFDLDAPLADISAFLSRFELLASGFINQNVPRLPVAFDAFEFVVRAILGQQITVKAATTLAQRIAVRADFKTPPSFPEGLTHFFPNVKESEALALDGLGITSTRQATLKRVVIALLNGDFSLSPYQRYDAFHKQFGAIKGIGDWTVNYVAMRGLGIKDSFPASDLGVMNVMAAKLGAEKLTAKAIEHIAEDWKPYRAYATLCLWQHYPG